MRKPSEVVLRNVVFNTLTLLSFACIQCFRKLNRIDMPHTKTILTKSTMANGNTACIQDYDDKYSVYISVIARKGTQVYEDDVVNPAELIQTCIKT